MEEAIPRNSKEYSRYLMGKARHLMERARQKELMPHNISSRQANVMFILYKLDHKPTLNELAKHLDREINTLSSQMTRMERDGLVKKVRENPKSTLLKFELTKKGYDIFENSCKMISTNAIMSVLTEEECQQLISILNKIILEAEKY